MQSTGRVYIAAVASALLLTVETEAKGKKYMHPKELIARTLWQENRNHNDDGLRLVAESIWNRAERRHKRTPIDTMRWDDRAAALVAECLRKEPGQKHFAYSAWDDFKLWTRPIPKDGPDQVMWQKALVLANDLIMGTFKPSSSLTNYCNIDCNPWWEKSPKMIPLGERAGMKTFREEA